MHNRQVSETTDKKSDGAGGGSPGPDAQPAQSDCTFSPTEHAPPPNPPEPENRTEHPLTRFLVFQWAPLDSIVEALRAAGAFEKAP